MFVGVGARARGVAGQCRRGLRGVVLAGVVMAGVVRAIVPTPLAAHAAQDARPGAGPGLVVGDDAGGALLERLRRVRRLRREGVSVEITGRFCLSACTLYLGLPRTCISPRTRFGFHGPSTRFAGVALPPEKFERWSREMAEFYPEPLRGWFLETARHRIVGFYSLSGDALIAMGIRRCPTSRRPRPG